MQHITAKLTGKGFWSGAIPRQELSMPSS